MQQAPSASSASCSHWWRRDGCRSPPGKIFRVKATAEHAEIAEEVPFVCPRPAVSESFVVSCFRGLLESTHEEIFHAGCPDCHRSDRGAGSTARRRGRQG